MTTRYTEKEIVVSAILMFTVFIFSLVLLVAFSLETWNVMAWDGLVQPTGKYRSIRHREYPKFQTRLFGGMESAHYLDDLLFWYKSTSRSKLSPKSSSQTQSDLQPTLLS